MQHRELLGVKLSPICISYFSDAKRGESAMQKLPPFLYALRGETLANFHFLRFRREKSSRGGNSRYFSDAKRGESAMQKLPPFLYALRGGNSRKFSFSTFSTRKELLGGKLSQICTFSKLLRGGNARKFSFPTRKEENLRCKNYLPFCMLFGGETLANFLLFGGEKSSFGGEECSPIFIF